MQRLFQPKSILVIGGGVGLKVVGNLVRAKYQGNIWVIHPSLKQIEGIACFQSLDQLPAVPDACYLAVNRLATIEYVGALSKLGAGGAVIYASGFKERDHGIGLQAELVEAAGDMPILGPNCYGFLNYLDDFPFWPDDHGGKPIESGVALITQSSNIAVNMTMQRRGLPLAMVITAGNQAQTSLAKIATHLLSDQRISVLALHIEGVEERAPFITLFEQARLRKVPIVILKIGSSPLAQQMALSHTAAMGSEDKFIQAFFDHYGIARVHSLPELLEAAKLLHVLGPLKGRSISSMSCSGGEAGVIADAVSKRNLHFPSLKPNHANALQATLNEFVAIDNPLDYHTFIWGKLDQLTATFQTMLEGEFDFNMLILDYLKDDLAHIPAWQAATDAIIAANKAIPNAKVAVVTSLPENLPEFRSAEYIQAGIAPLAGFEEALSAVEAGATIGEGYQKEAPQPLLPLHSEPYSQRQVLTEFEGKTILATSKIAIPHGILLKDNNAEKIKDFINQRKQMANIHSFVVKAHGAGMMHKSEHQAVRLNLETTDDIQAAIKDLLPLSGEILLEDMANKPLVEILVGVIYDPILGYALTLGAGGVEAELWQDTTTLLLPASDDQIQNALKGLKIYKKLLGWRGAKPADFQAIVHLGHQITDLIMHQQNHNQPILELDINPIMVYEMGSSLIAADCLMVIAKH